LAYSFLEDLSQEFYAQFGHKINTATRPYSFIEFGRFSFLLFSFHSFSFDQQKIPQSNFKQFEQTSTN
jgi:hypothetical protein